MAKRSPPIPEDEFRGASLQEIIGASRLRDLPTLDVAALTRIFGPAIHPGDDSRYGPTWAVKDEAGNAWSIYTLRGTWQISGRGIRHPSKPNVASTNRFVEYLQQHCKEVRS